VGATVAIGVELAEAIGDGLKEGIVLANAGTGRTRFRPKTIKNNRKVSFRMES
jgi:hypothetical protein